MSLVASSLRACTRLSTRRRHHAVSWSTCARVRVQKISARLLYMCHWGRKGDKFFNQSHYAIILRAATIHEQYCVSTVRHNIVGNNKTWTVPPGVPYCSLVRWWVVSWTRPMLERKQVAPASLCWSLEVVPRTPTDGLQASSSHPRWLAAQASYQSVEEQLPQHI